MPTFNTTDPKPGYVYDSATDTWFPLVGIAPASQVDRWTFTAAGGETSLSGNDDNAVSLSYTSGTEQVYLNGVLLVRGQDYTATNGTSITGLTALAASDVAEVVTFNPSNILTTDAILDTDFTAKGDLISASAASTPIRIPVGTNGQVLKANSATTSGLEWGALDDADAIQNSIVDAKGDLIVGSADNTPTKLTAGVNGLYLSTDSSTTSGLVWTTTPSTPSVAIKVAAGTTADTVTATYSFTASPYLVSYFDTSNISSVTFGSATATNTTFAVLGASTSSASITPNRKWSPVINLDTTIRAFAYNNNVYVIGGDSTNLYWSTNGTTWTTRAHGIAETPNSIGYHQSTFVVVANQGRVATSTDGITWTSRNGTSTGSWYGLASGNGLIMIAGNTGRVATSTNGVTWTSRYAAPFGSDFIGNLAFGAGLFVAYGQSGTTATSTDGVSWTARTSTMSTGPKQPSTALVFGDKFVMGAANARIATSTDGITWSTRPTVGTSAINTIAYLNGHYLLGSDDGVGYFSTDGITWSSRNTNSTYGTGSGVSPNGFVFGQNKYTAILANGFVTTASSSSTHGQTLSDGYVVIDSKQETTAS